MSRSRIPIILPLTGLGRLGGQFLILITRWTPEALPNALYLNNKYEWDGRDPDGFTGAARCFGKPDRPWKERPIFENVRYMNDKRWKRKFDADGQVNMMDPSDKAWKEILFAFKAYH
jgi:hypothetical protein